MPTPWSSSSSGSVTRAALVAIALACLMAVRCGGSGTPGTPTPPPTGTPTPPGDPTPTPPGPTTPPPSSPQIFVGAGDIAMCGRLAPAEATGKLLSGIGGTVFTLGDNAYDHGTAEEYNCYDRAWGPVKGWTRPVPGNHEYEAGANPINYFNYFGGNAGTRGDGWYSFDMGEWHAIALNSNLPITASSRQGVWLKNDLALYKNWKCTVAYWHHPPFTSGQNGPQNFMRETWKYLHSEGVDVVLTGHDHLYERFLPMDGDGNLVDQSRGMVEFVVGTGGANPLYRFITSGAPTSARRIAAFGVLKLTLKSGGYEFQFINANVPGTSTETDVGNGLCH